MRKVWSPVTTGHRLVHLVFTYIDPVYTEEFTRHCYDAKRDRMLPWGIALCYACCAAEYK